MVHTSKIISFNYSEKFNNRFLIKILKQTFIVVMKAFVTVHCEFMCRHFAKKIAVEKFYIH